MPSPPLYERCTTCNGSRVAPPGTRLCFDGTAEERAAPLASGCPGCRGVGFVETGLTLGQVERLKGQRDALLQAALEAIPFMRTAILQAVRVPGFDPNRHVVLAPLIAAARGCRAPKAAPDPGAPCAAPAGEGVAPC